VATELVGVAEIARMLGVSRQRVDQMARSDPEFPAPVAELTAGRIWRLQDIERWARSTGRVLERDG
jgi:predicted DNA-binding transcriptional regulator AlpA